ncbi:hypothetical protein C8R43DRAFT_1142054 [Mycena crocata]|nr:hypothetical protein C8R43DRAFT_1142054 [Mycena crocata]
MAELVFVTGASGFLGSHVVLQLLQAGYHVRVVARGVKADQLRVTYASYGGNFEAVSITDIVDAELPLAGVDAIIHMACPLPGRAEPAAMLSIAKEGTLNVLLQGEKAGVKRFIVTSSVASMMNPSKSSYTDQDWVPLTVEFALNGGNKMATYAGAKKFAELALWEWADNHPHVEVTTLNPTFFFGPFTPHYPVPDLNALATNVSFYNLLFCDGIFPATTYYIDVRDIAKVHILALKGLPTAEVGRKRLLLSSPHGWSHYKTVEFIKTQRPALQERLITTTPVDLPCNVLRMDLGRLEKVLGMRITDFHTIEETTLDTIDALLEVEEKWQAAGHVVGTHTPPSFSNLK